ncbi:seipin [Aspergillus clavatus NRRL 1]|uniref:Adipose-regulatory protein n=1 Tax=Aspergillus clavatus (strain ATCC 1007 / CBS 513.65 / DSM 816 / NCTC 3887 / NRRL 1 / QM 1276 / 107) TaxID=344612 RepID=A1CKC5_ASPCL|nr:uncharacterized protein ACLA_038090 [Aspergillus clavatus NRRL 1]EAW09599.1 conserved hypothetical protein [Aspergillus clavatus NRRL 1]
MASIQDALLTPVRALVSKPAQKAYLGTLLFVITAIGLSRDVHLQFGDGHPWGTASLGPELVSQQAYDVTVKLELPRTPPNLAAGNFMLDLSLFSRPSTAPGISRNISADRITHSRRPTILTYTSPMVDTASKISLLPLYVLGWHREAETLVVPMLEKIEFPRGWRNLPTSLRLEVDSQQQMQVYSARVEFRARFRGLRWVMYNWRILSFLVFSFAFWSVSMASTSFTWVVLASIWSSKTDDRLAIKREDRGKTPIKEEPDDETTDLSALESSSDSQEKQPLSRTKKEEDSEEETKQPYTSDTDDDSPTVHGTRHARPGEESGAGTGRESAEARGVQRRRSRISKEDRS